jgi:PAS domain S-box-containing protein
MHQPLRLLIVDDSKDDANQLLRALRPAGYEPAYEIVDTSPTMRTALEHHDWDVITSDHAMPQFSAPEALALAKEIRPNAPFIVVSGEINLDLAVSLMKDGARDYIRKEELERLVPTIAEVMREVEVKRQQKEAERSLQVSEVRYRRLFETAQDGILMLDAATGQITDVNPYLIKMLGFPQSYFVGKRLWEIGTFKDSEASKSSFLELQIQGYIRYEDLPLQASDDRRIAVEFVSNVYAVGDKQVIQCNIRNITRRKEAEEALHQVNADLEQQMRDRTAQLQVFHTDAADLHHAISHDLKAPLRRMAGFAKALKEDCAGNLDENGLAFVQRIVTSSQHFGSMLDGLTVVSDVARIELQRQTIDLTTMARGLAAEFQAAAPERRIAFVIAEGITANCDQKLMQKVLENLFSNASKFTINRALARVEFGIAPQTDGRVAYFVRDNGIGLDMAVVDRIFGIFQRLHTGAAFQGTGVGLAIVQRIIHLHGGRIWAEGTENLGATFYFTL